MSGSLTMGSNCDEFLSLFLFGNFIVLIISGIYVAKPNLHGLKFKYGTCNLSSVETVSTWNELPDCSCGKSCTEKYPCIKLRVSCGTNIVSLQAQAYCE